MLHYIYTLSDPISNNIKYIGQTKNLKDRLQRHMNPSNLKSTWTPKSKWLKYLKNNNLKPIMEVLDIGDENIIDDLEIYWIGQFKQWGFKLKNTAKGGKYKITHKGDKLSDKHKKNLKNTHPNCKIVQQYTLDNMFVSEYISIAEAKRQTGLTHIGCCCRGVRKRCGNYYFRYKDNYFPYIERVDYWTGNKHKPKSIEKMKMNHPLRKVVIQYDIETDEIINRFLSLHEVSEKTGLSRIHISKCCKGIKSYNSVGGYYFRFEDNYFPYNKPNNKPIKIYQYDKNMNLINIFKSYRDVKNDNFTPKLIKEKMDKNDTYKDFYWKSKKF
jgi:hypothetical protein